MYNGGYLVPANAKKGTLIFNIFRPFDLILFGSGCGVTILLIAIFNTAPFWAILLICMPAAICGLLVVPIPNYHNVLCALTSMFDFYNKRRKFVWRGWCYYEYFKETNDKSK